MKPLFKNNLFAFFLVLIQANLLSQTPITVFNNNNSGSGSLRQALITAINSPNNVTINFQSSITTITLQSSIEIQNNAGKTITINGQGRVKLKGTGIRSINGFQINNSAGTVNISGLHFENFISGIVIYSYAVIKNNVFTKNSIGILATTKAHIYENYIGTDQNLSANLGNDDNIVILGSGIEINDNTICSAKQSGISGSGSGYIYNNTIGTNLFPGLGNQVNAIKLANGHFAISNNSIIGNGGGISTNRSELRKNTLFCNGGTPFTSSNPYAKPIVTTLKYNQNGSVSIAGTSNASGDYIEIFQYISSTSCPNALCQGESIANTTSNAAKQWSATFTPRVGSEIFVSASKSGDLLPPFEGNGSQGSSSLFTDCQIPQCPNVAISFQTLDSVNCYGGNDGQAKITITPTGNGGQYEYTITQTNVQPNVTTAPKTIVSTDTLKTLKSGTYSVTVINKLTKCSYNASNSITIAQPSAPLSMSSCRELSPVTSANNDAVGQVIVAGGTPPYSLTVTRPNSTTDTISYQASGTFNIPNLSPGIYKVNAFDGNYPTGKPNTGCVAACTFTINTVNCTTLKLNIKTTNHVLCKGDSTGRIVVKYSDLIANFPLTLTLNNSFSQIINAFSSDSTFVISNLPANNYNITLTNKLNCSTTTSTTITEPSHLNVTCDTVIAAKRVGEASGSAKITLNGGQEPYQIVVTGPTNINRNSATATQITFNNLAKGNYIATVYDSNLCTDTCHFTILEPNCLGFNVIPTIDTIRCFGEKNGSIRLLTVNGLLPINYIWSDAMIGNQAVANNLDVGTYTVTITDDRNCKDTVTAQIITPSVLTTNLNITNIQAVGQTGQIAITVNGGTTNYRVVLTSGGNIVPLNTQNGNVFNFNNLPKGTYISTTTDANDCVKIDTIRITDPNCNFELRIQQVNNVSCYGGNDGQIILTHNNPNVIVNYVWGQTGIGDTSHPIGLKAGLYSVTATTSQNCTDSLEITISQPDSLIVFSTPHDVTIGSGSDGYIEVRVNGGTQPYMVRLGMTNATRINANSFIFNDLIVGNYTIIVTDANGCTTSQNVSVNAPNCNMTVSSRIDAVLCKGDPTGRVILTLTNGVSPLIYNWSPPSVSTSDTAKNLAAGTYSVTVTDARQCTATTTAIVSEPNLALSTTALPSAVLTTNDGKIAVSVRGGTLPYSVKFGNTNATRLTDTTFIFNDLSANNYTIIVTDANGCTTTQTVTVNNSRCNIIAQIYILQTISCYGASNGRLSVIAQNAQTPQYNWSPNLGNTANPTGLAAGNYTVTVNDARGCSATAQMRLTEPLQIRASLFGDTTICAGQSTKLRFSVLDTNTFSLTFTNGRDTFRTTHLEEIVTPSANTVYKLLSVQSGTCFGLITNNNRAIVNIPFEKANAGTDITECNTLTSFLNAAAIVNQNMTGRWTALDGGVVANPANAKTIVNNLNAGTNRFVWLLSNAFCGEVSRDTVVIFANAKPELATTQQINLDSKLTTVLINIQRLLKNRTIDPSVFSLKILKFPDKSLTESRDSGIFFDRNGLTEAQKVEIEFEICHKSCPNQCSKGKMVIVLQPLLDDSQLSVPKIFAINNRNAASLDINGLDFYLEYEITIVNRWGEAVFGPVSNKNYKPERSWDGKKDGQPLPTGAYYYFIRYKDKEILKDKKGIIYLVEEQ